MNAYPLQLNLEGRLCVVVGGGRVGERKVKGLLAGDARVRLVEPQDSAPACQLAGIERVARKFEEQDIAGALLVFAATDDPEVNALIAEKCREHGVLCNRVDDPCGGDFSLPAIVRRGDLLFTVSSHGAHPGFSVALRDQLADSYGEVWGEIGRLARLLRRRRLTPGEAESYNRKVLRVLKDERLPTLFAEHDYSAIKRLIREFLGDDFPSEEIEALLPTDTP